MIKEGGNIRQWSQEVLADAIIQYTQLVLQLANLTATDRASLVRTHCEEEGAHWQQKRPPQGS